MILLVLNPRSGSADPDRVVEALRRRFGEVALWSPDGDECFTEALRAQLETRRPSLVVASGGDGTVSAVATAIADHDLPLGIVPCGTANVFAREVGIPLDVDDACDVIADRHEHRFDTLEIAGRRCLCRVGFGVFSTVGQETAAEDKQALGRLAYVRSALPHLIERADFAIELEVDGRAVRTRGSGVVVTNVSAIGFGDLRWGDGVRADDGVADALILHADRLSEKLSVLWNTIAGKTDAAADVSHLAVRDHVTVRTEPPSPVVADGEVLPAGKYRVTVRPASLSVCVPAPPPA